MISKLQHCMCIVSRNPSFQFENMVLNKSFDCTFFLQGLSPEELALIALEVRQSLEGLTSPNLSNISTNRGLVPLSSTLAALTLKCVDSAKQVSTALQAFNAYHGPSPVPSFDAFVQAHKLLQQTLSKALSKLLPIVQYHRCIL